MRGLGGIYRDIERGRKPRRKDSNVFEIVAIVFVIGCTVALVEWWKGPEIPKR